MVVQILKILAHEVHHLHGAGVGALRHLRETGAAQQLELFHGETDHEVGGRLDAPVELDAAPHQAFGDADGALAIHQEIVIDNPQQFQVVAAHQIGGLFHHLVRIERIPLAAVDAVVGAVAAVVGAGETRRVHGPAPAADPLIGVEIGQVIGLRRHLAQGAQRARGVEANPAVLLVADARNAFQRFAGLQAPHDFEQRVLALSHDHGIDVFGRQGLIREQRGMPSAQNDRHLRIEPLDLAGDLHGLADHGAGDQGHRQADGVFEFFDHALLEIRRDGGIDDLYLIPGVAARAWIRPESPGARSLPGWKRPERRKPPFCAAWFGPCY